MPAGVAEKAAAAGVSVVRTYGMSETAGGCVYDGVPLDGVLVRIDDGRVVLGGATVAKGYRNPVDPDPFAEPGWFRTDDLGVVDNSGVLTVLGRVDDAISTGGLTVLPQLVEAALAGHPGVADCAVFGVPDERLGQRVVAAVVVAPGRAAPTLAELRAHVASSLDATAAPREVHVVEELPRRGIGKLDRATAGRAIRRCTMSATALVRRPSSRLAEGIVSHIERRPVDVGLRDRAVGGLWRRVAHAPGGARSRCPPPTTARTASSSRTRWSCTAARP